MSITLRPDALPVSELPTQTRKGKPYNPASPENASIKQKLDNAPGVWHIVGVIDGLNAAEIHRERQAILYQLNGDKRGASVIKQKYHVAIRRYYTNDITDGTQVKIVYAKRNELV
jgi:hypothetical protein